MSTVNQIYSIMNSLNAQANSGSSIDTVDTRSFISYGESISSLSDANKETWFATLIDRIASTIIDNRAYYTQEANGLWREPFEYGAALQKIHAKMPSVVADPAWLSPSDLSSTNPFAPTAREIEQRIYNKISAFMIADTIPDVQLKTAFLSEQKMAAFLDSLMMTTQNAFTRSVENLARACRSALIATSVNEGGAHYVKLLTGFKATLDEDDPRASWTTSDIDAIMVDRDFLRYAASQIAKHMRRMKSMTDIFAADGYERWTPEEYLNVAIHADFEENISTYLAADAYHDQLVTIPDQNKVIVPFWQATGSDYGFETSSNVKMTIPRTTGTAEQQAAGYTINEKYIVAALYDSEAAGITIDERRTRALYNPKDEFTNYWHKGREMYYIDATHPHVIFQIA